MMLMDAVTSFRRPPLKYGGTPTSFILEVMSLMDAPPSFVGASMVIHGRQCRQWSWFGASRLPPRTSSTRRLWGSE